MVAHPIKVSLLSTPQPSPSLPSTRASRGIDGGDEKPTALKEFGRVSNQSRPGALHIANGNATETNNTPVEDEALRLEAQPVEETIAIATKANDQQEQDDAPNYRRQMICCTVLSVAIIAGLVIGLAGRTTEASTVQGFATDAPSNSPSSPPTLSLSPTGAPSTNPTEMPTRVASSAPTDSCGIEYPSKPQAKCVGRFDPQRNGTYGDPFLGYTFEMDCGAFGDLVNRTGLWELGRTSVTALDGTTDDWKIAYGTDLWRRDFVPWTEDTCLFQISVLDKFWDDDQEKCLRIRYKDNACGKEYTSDCIALDSCPQEGSNPSCDVTYPAKPEMICDFREPYGGEYKDDDGFVYEATRMSYSMGLVNSDAYGDMFTGCSTCEGSFDPNRTTVIVYDEDWRLLPQYGGGSREYLSVDLPIDDVLSCLQYQMIDTRCARVYTTDCFEVSGCTWD